MAAVRLDGQYVVDKGPDMREKVRAIAAWDAQDEYQLSFDEGEIITILDKFAGNPTYDGPSVIPVRPWPLGHEPLRFPRVIRRRHFL